MKAQATSTSDCPCGSGHALAACCGRLHAGTPAADAEALMRSRYSAYVLGLEAYLLATWHPATRPATLALDVAPCPQWLGLAISAHARQDAHHATVAFTARYKLNGRAFRLSEVSRFERQAGHWFYVDGEIGS